MEKTKRADKSLLLRTVMTATLALGLAGCSGDAQKQSTQAPKTRMHVIDEGDRTAFVEEFAIPARAPYDKYPPLTGAIVIEQGKIGSRHCNPRMVLYVPIGQRAIFYAPDQNGLEDVYTTAEIRDLPHQLRILEVVMQETVSTCVNYK